MGQQPATVLLLVGATRPPHRPHALTSTNAWSAWSSICPARAASCELPCGCRLTANASVVSTQRHPAGTPRRHRAASAAALINGASVTTDALHGALNGSRLPLFCLETEPLYRTALRAASQQLCGPTSPVRHITTRPGAGLLFSFFSSLYLNVSSLIHAPPWAGVGAGPLATLAAAAGGSPPLVSAFLGHCDSSYGDRSVLLRALAARLHGGVASYGACARTVSQAESSPHEEAIVRAARGAHMSKLGTRSKAELLARHPFHLVAENSRQDGWLTEKVYQAFAAGAVPIFQGAPRRTVEHLLPAHSVVFAEDFDDDATRLAPLLERIAASPQKLALYHRWRGTAATRRLFAWLRNVSLDTALCRVCDEVRGDTVAPQL